MYRLRCDRCSSEFESVVINIFPTYNFSDKVPATYFIAKPHYDGTKDNLEPIILCPNCMRSFNLWLHVPSPIVEIETIGRDTTD